MEHNIMGIDPSDSQNHAIFNATTQKRNTVDPRTGLFEVYVPLPAVTGNAGAGPVVDMSLFYTPVVNNAAGLGDGWSFAFTHYHEENQQLTLHSGEVLRVEKDKELEQPAVIATWDQGTLTVLRRDGRVEVLKQLGDTQIYMPETLTTDGYNFLTLGWTSTAHVINDSTHHQIQLTQIKDATRVLLKVEYTDESAEINFWPDDASEKLSFKLALENHALKSVTAADGTTCTFGYQDHATCGWLLNEFNSFEGLKETVAYEDDGLRFENNQKLSALPCVGTHTLSPRLSTADVKTYYSYDWVDSTKYTTTVRMGASENDKTIQGLVDNSIRKTVYEYNERHEMVKETKTQEEASVVVHYSETLHEKTDMLDRSTIIEYQKDQKIRKKTVLSKLASHGAIYANAQCEGYTEWHHTSGEGSNAQKVLTVLRMASAGALDNGYSIEEGKEYYNEIINSDFGGSVVMVVIFI